MNSTLYTGTAIAMSLLLAPAIAGAADFTIVNAQTVTATQALGGGDTGTIDSGGTIAVDNSDLGILGTGNNITITNNGTITSGPSGSNGYAIRIDGNSANVTNNGTISSNGNVGILVVLLGDNSSGINNGTLSSTNNNAYAFGLGSGSHNSTLVNNNAITTSGSGSHGIYIAAAFGGIGDSLNNTLTNNGTISTTGSGSFGMATRDNDNTLINNGTITTSNAGSDGMAVQSGATGNALTNNSVINVSGAGTDGMVAVTSNTLTNNGRIVVSSGTGNALRGAGNNITITNNGYATAPGDYAVEMTGNNNTLVLGINSQVVGNVTWGGSGGLLQYNVSGGDREGGSVTTVNGTISGTHTTSVTNSGSLGRGAKVAQSGNTVAVVTPDNFAGSEQAVTQAINYSSNIVNQRQQLALVDKPKGLSAGDEPKNHKAWVEGFGSYQERPAEDNSAFSRSRSGGVLAGVDLPQNSSGYKSGAYVGGFAGSTDLGKSSFRQIDSNGAMVGGYIGKEYRGHYVSGQLQTGFSSNDSDRNTGIDTAKANYNSYFISPSVTITKPYAANGVTLVPSATLRYTGQYAESYTESGSVANQSVDSHFTNSVGAKAQVEAHLTEKKIRNGVLKPTFRAGIEGDTIIGNNNVDVTVLSTNISLDPKGYDSNVDGILGANVSYTLNGGAELYFDAEANAGLNKGSVSDNFGGTGRVGARWNF